MKTHTMNRRVIWMLLILFVYLVGCSTSSHSTVVSPATVQARVNTAPSPIVNPSLTLTPEQVSITHTPIILPTPLLTLTPTLESTLSPTPSPTSAPTLTVEEEYILVSTMLQDNGGCQLPCWWGFTPGETSWSTVESFFASWGKQAGKYQDSDITNYTIHLNNLDRRYSHSQTYYEEDGRITFIVLNAVPSDDVGYAYGDAQFAAIWQSVMLPRILEVYGPPSQVFLGTGGAPWRPFDLLLFYPNKGFLVEYSGVTEEENDGARRVCPHRAGIALYLWPPATHVDLEDVPDVLSAHADDEKWGPYPLEDATGTSTEQFYQTFVKSDDQICLEAPSDLW